MYHQMHRYKIFIQENCILYIKPDIKLCSDLIFNLKSTIGSF